MNELAWFIEDATPLRRYAVELLSEAVGLRARLLERPPDQESPYVHHGSAGDARAGALIIPTASGERPAVEVEVRRDGTHWVLSADVVDGTAALTTDAVHAGVDRTGLDRHGRLRSEASYLATRGVAGAPVVNHYAAAIEMALPLIGSFSPRPRWPDGRRAAIGLSHDVDRPDKYAILRAAANLRLPPPDRLPWFIARTLRDLTHRLRDPRPDDFWLFDEVVAAEAAHGLRSTFLFSVMPAYGSYGSTNDVLYDAAWPHLRRAMRTLRDAEVELGLHASYHAYRDAARFVAEKARLEELSGGPVRGLRHHFWQVGPDLPRTLRAHEAAGFVYDSSIAFNDVAGLRRGIALPYRPWDAAQGRRLATWQLPVIALDSAVCGTMRSTQEGIDTVWAAIEGVIDAGGVAVLDWHVRCSVPANDRYRAWGEVYLGVVERLAARADVWTAGLGEIADWAQQRSDLIATS